MKKLLARALALLLALAVAAPATAQLLPPLPGGSLIVTVTSPAAGSMVSGTVPVSASVSIVGSLTVSRVDFFVDNNFIGSDSTASYSVSWDTRTVGNGSHSLTAVAQDVLGVRWTSSAVSVTVGNDTTRPTVTINQASTQADPTSASPINFTVVFSESVSSFTGSDVTIGGTAGGTKTRTVTGGPRTYNVAVSGMTSSGTVSASIGAGVAQDAAGNTNTASTSTDNSVQFNLPDSTPPTVAITSPAAGTTVSGTIKVSANASDNVGIAGVQFKLDDIDNNLGAEERFAPYEISWDTATVSNGQHTIAAVARDAAGNQTTSAPVTFTVANDKTSPTVSINQAATQADPTSASPINFTVVFSEPVSGFTGSDVAIAGTAAGTKSVAVSGGPSTYTVAVSGMTSSGTVIATIPSGRANDAAGNTNTVSTSTDNTVQFNLPDTTRPSVTINQAATQADPTGASPINFTVVFSEPVSGFTGSDVAIGGTAGATTAAVSGGPSTYTVAVSGMTSSGSVSATIGAGLAQDAAGNTNTASTSTDNSVQFNRPDTTPPTVSITSPMSGATVKDTITITANASDAGSGIAVVDFFIDGATTPLKQEFFAPYEAPWNTTAVANGSHTITAVARDNAGNSTTSAQVTVTVANGDTAPPAPTITSFSPISGPIGTSVTITGTNFTGATALTFNGVTATGSVDSDTQITATVPSGATTGPISVTTPGGIATSSTSFTVTTAAGAPTITSFSPTSGPIGTSVTITGTNFTGATALTFNGVTATGSVDSDTQITATVPSGATTGPISVTTPGGIATSASAFTVTGDVSAATTSAASATTRIEDSDPAVSYIGGWIHLTDPRGTNGTAAIANVAGAMATLSFTGTEVRWLGYRYDGGGIARVSIDGTFVGEVNTYSASPVLGEVFTAAFLSSGAHTLTIQVTGTSDPAAVDSWVIIDAFDVTP